MPDTSDTIFTIAHAHVAKWEGGLTDHPYVSTTGSGVPVVPAMNVQPDVQAAQMLIQQVQNQIKEGLYNDLFRMLLGSDRRQVTATEVDAKEAEKMILIGPVLERLHDELFIPLIDRTFELMGRFNALPPAPESIAGETLKVDFISTLAQAQKLVSTGSMQQIAAETLASTPVGGEQPTALDAHLGGIGGY